MSKLKYSSFLFLLSFCIFFIGCGSANSEFELGEKHYAGDDVPKDFTMAAKLFKKAAKSEHAQAQYRLGRMYNMGEGVAKNHREAFKWYQKSAEQGNVYGQYNWPHFIILARVYHQITPHRISLL